MSKPSTSFQARLRRRSHSRPKGLPFSFLLYLAAFQMLRATLPQLTDLQCDNGNTVAAASQALERFSTTNAQLVQETRDEVFARGLQLQREIADRGQFWGWQALTLFIVSLALALLFTRMINRLGEGRERGVSGAA